MIFSQFMDIIKANLFFAGYPIQSMRRQEDSPMPGITAKDIAAKLNLSPSAVSLALNGKPGVSEATRALVVETAMQLGYSRSDAGNNMALSASDFGYRCTRNHPASFSMRCTQPSLLPKNSPVVPPTGMTSFPS